MRSPRTGDNEHVRVRPELTEGPESTLSTPSTLSPTQDMDSQCARQLEELSQEFKQANEMRDKKVEELSKNLTLINVEVKGRKMDDATRKCEAEIAKAKKQADKLARKIAVQEAWQRWMMDSLTVTLVLLGVFALALVVTIVITCWLVRGYRQQQKA